MIPTTVANSPVKIGGPVTAGLGFRVPGLGWGCGLFQTGKKLIEHHARSLYQIPRLFRLFFFNILLTPGYDELRFELAQRSECNGDMVNIFTSMFARISFRNVRGHR